MTVPEPKRFTAETLAAFVGLDVRVTHRGILTGRRLVETGTLVGPSTVTARPSVVVAWHNAAGRRMLRTIDVESILSIEEVPR